MIELTNLEAQTVAPGESVIFSTIVYQKGCSEHFKPGSGKTTLLCPGDYLVTFSGNIAVPTGQTVGSISLAIDEDGENLIGTTMTTTPGGVERYGNVAAQTISTVLKHCNQVCCKAITIKNVSGIPILVNNPNIVITRRE